VWKKKKKDLFTFTSEWLMIDTIPTQEHWNRPTDAGCSMRRSRCQSWS
jgi:hypothetical protein